MPKTIDFDQVADIYDIYVTTQLDVAFFIKEAQQASGAVLELMSGTGRVSLPVLEQGVALSCVDYSEKMLAVLRDKLKAKELTAEIHQLDVCDLDLEQQFELIFIPFHSFSEIISPKKQVEALRRIYDHLTPSGRFICTLHNPAVRLKTADGLLRFRGQFNYEHNQLVLSHTEQYDPQSSCVNGLQFFEHYDINRNLLAKKMLDIKFFVHDYYDFRTLVTSVGFQVVTLYGDYHYAAYEAKQSPFMIWVLQKWPVF
ncbi:MAG: class I SAM-dependent methyltransferase [Pseudomonadota bacterium]|nr:class I SAM-dependent methyltransferase [Pseudomonadota bacterium]